MKQQWAGRGGPWHQGIGPKMPFTALRQGLSTQELLLSLSQGWQTAPPSNSNTAWLPGPSPAQPGHAKGHTPALVPLKPGQG